MICRRSVSAALLGDEALLGEAGIAQRILEPGAVELAVRRLECRIAGDASRDFGIGHAEPHLRGALVEPGLRRPSRSSTCRGKPKRARLFRRDRHGRSAGRAAAARSLIGLAELIGSGFRSLPILASAERPKPRKMSLMPQMAKLPASSVMTTPMTMRPSQLAEALRIPRSMCPTLWSDAGSGCSAEGGAS